MTLLNLNESPSNNPSRVSVSATPEPTSPFQVTWHGIVRCIGVVILCFGLWMAYQLVKECWSLYNDPSKMEKFAEHVAKGSDIDKSGESLTQFVGELTGEAAGVKDPKKLPAITPTRFSYFAAWFLSIILFWIIGKISFWAISTGTKIATDHADQEQIAKSIAKEVIGTAFTRLELQQRQ